MSDGRRRPATSGDRSPPAPFVDDPVELTPQTESVTEPTADPQVPFRLASLGGQTLLFGIVTVLNMTVSFIMLPLYTRYLKPPEYGAIELIELTFDILTMIAGARLVGGVFRYYYKAKTEDERRAVISTSAILICGGYAVVGIAAFLAAEPIARLALGDVKFAGLVRIGSLALASQSLTSLPPALLRVQGKFNTVVMIQVGRLIMQVGFNVLFLVYFRFGPASIFLSTLIANVTLGGAMLVMVLRPVGLQYSRQVAGALYRFGAPLIAVQGATFILTFGDRYFLRAATDLYTVGIYALAYKFAFALASVTQTPFNLVWEPKRFEIATHDNHDAIYARVFVYFNVVLLASGLGLAMFVHDLLHVIATPPYFIAADYVPVLVVAIVLQGWAGTQDTGILVSERTGFLALSNWVAAGVTLVAYAILIPWHRAWGAAIATVIGYAVRYVLTYTFSQRVWPIQYTWAPVIRLAIITSITYALSRLIPWGPLAYMLPARIFLFVAYLVVVYFARIVTPQDRAKARRMIARFLMPSTDGPPLAVAATADRMRAS